MSGFHGDCESDSQATPLFYQLPMSKMTPVTIQFVKGLNLEDDLSRLVFFKDVVPMHRLAQGQFV